MNSAAPGKFLVCVPLNTALQSENYQNAVGNLNLIKIKYIIQINY